MQVAGLMGTGGGGDVGGPPPPSFTVNPIKFDGSNDYIRYGNQTHYGDKFTMACWFKRQSTTAFDTFFSTNAGVNGTEIEFNGSTLRIQAYTWPGGATLGQWVSSTSFNDTDWHHVRVAMDSTNQLLEVYTDGTLESMSGSWSTTGNMDLYQFTWGVGTLESNDYDGCLAEMWMDLAYYDNATYPITGWISGGEPVDLGADGSNPTGAQPHTYLKDTATTCGTNYGSAADYNEIGTLTDCSTSPQN